MEFIIPQYIKSSTCVERYVAHHQEPQLYLKPLVYIRMWWSPVVWVGTGLVVTAPLRLDYGRSPHAYVNQRLQIQLGLLVMSDIPLETCWAFKVLWNNKFRYQVASCWLLLLSKLLQIASFCASLFCGISVHFCIFTHTSTCLKETQHSSFSRNGQLWVDKRKIHNALKLIYTYIYIYICIYISIYI